MIARRRRSVLNLRGAETAPLIRLWLLRLLVPLHGHKRFIAQDGLNDEAMADMLELGQQMELSERDFDQRMVRLQLRRRYHDAERRAHRLKPPRILAENIKRLCRLVGLSRTDCRILEFAVLIHSERILDDAADWLGQLSSAKLYQVLAIVLDIPEPDIRSSLSPRGILGRSGLLVTDRAGLSTLREKLALLSDKFADLMLSSCTDPVSLLRDMVVPCTRPDLSGKDYEHIASSLSILRPYLRHAQLTKRRGVNIFLYGQPGTGKSQLARVLAQELGYELFEITGEDENGDPVKGEQRLRALRAAQSFFAQRQVLILFDEVEDVFNDGNSLFGPKGTAQIRKAWINRILEGNPVATLWLSNSIDGVDSAFVRRFDLIIELPIPPKRQREKIVREACKDLLSEQAMTRVVQASTLAPAVVARAASVIRSIKNDLPQGRISAAIELLINNTLLAQGHTPHSARGRHHLPAWYDTAFINTDADLDAMTRGLSQTRRARLCLHGPPGTGKTAYALWLAQFLDMPLMVKRASDLLSMWVDNSEKNIARAFSEADEDGALLLLDEVDSFLQERRDAQYAWEVSMINEVLTQIETYSGLFIACTNLMDSLDQAALRRFDFKVRFDFLKGEQIWSLLQRQCSELSIRLPHSALKARVIRLRNLTPGDFAVIARRHRCVPYTSASMVVDTLAAECTAKAGHKSIGFIPDH